MMISDKKISKQKFFGYFLSGVILIFCGLVLERYFSYRDQAEVIVRNFEKTLRQKENRFSEEIAKIKTDMATGLTYDKPGFARGMHGTYEKFGILLFIYDNDSLVYWSTNAEPVPEKRIPQNPAKERWIEKQKNGWFEVIRNRDSSRVFIGQILLCHSYLFENDYLSNTFGPGFSVPDKTGINTRSLTNRVVSSDGSYLCSLQIPTTGTWSPVRVYILFVLWLTGFILVLVSLYKLYCRFGYLFSSKWLFLLSLFTDVILLRAIQFYFKWPAVLYESDLFGPGSFSSSVLLPSLGDFLVNSILLLFFSYIFFRHYPGFSKLRHRNRLLRYSVAFLIVLVLAAFFSGIIRIIQELVINSTIPLDLRDISGISVYSIIGYIILSALFLSFFLVLLRALKSVSELTGIPELQIIKNRKTPGTSLTRMVLAILVFSVVGTLMLNRFNGSMEKEKRKMLAIKIGASRDLMAELLFPKIEQQMIQDTLLQKHLSEAFHNSTGSMDDSLSRYIQDTYFRGYWNNYSFQLTVCTFKKTLRVQPNNYLIDCRNYFQNLIDDFGRPTMSGNMYFLDYGYGYKNYLVVIPIDKIKPGETHSGENAYVEFSSKLIFQDLGYPGLLIDKKQGQMPDLSGYSYAYYRNGRLIHRVGNLQYTLEMDRRPSALLAHFYIQDGYSHYYYPVDKNNVLIVSKKENNFLDKIAPFSYLFLVFTLFSILFFTLIRFKDVLNISIFRLGDRLQLAMAGMLAVSLLIIGGLVVYYIIRLNTGKNEDNLSERTHSILVELQHKMTGMSAEGDLSRLNLDEMLTKFSNVFFTDLNLYDPGGRLIATSRPEIYDEGLSARLMNRKAFEKLKLRHNSYFIQKEKIGEHDYFSAYIPFFNERNRLLAYLNLPYFARQEDLKKEISSFLVAFINVYIFLIIVGIFTALVVSNYISRPLRILTSRIGLLSYGKSNDKIVWKRPDEIGRLVDEYNRMTDELARNAELLAVSERETAWREMARQVAHEIKNPLTPMKLSVQHLEKTWKEQTPDWEERLKRFTETMTEQIDSLSVIASEFSDFAKMPVTKVELIDMNEIVQNMKALYLETPGTRFEFKTDGMAPHTIRGDRKQLLRACTNLFNNAIQAIGDREDGRVLMELKRGEDSVVLTVSDNGVGIQKEQTGRIFQPNFTTKTGGSGMGLAIVKSIVNGLNGEITFSSEPGKGTTFTLVFPAEGNPGKIPGNG